MQTTRVSVDTHPLDFLSIREPSDDEDDQSGYELQKFNTIKEIIPTLNDDVIHEILRGNKYDVEKSLDAALALSISLATESGSTILKAASSDNGMNRSHESIPRTESSTERNVDPDKADLQEVETGKVVGRVTSNGIVKYSEESVPNRGTLLILPNKFLSPPRYRVVVTYEDEYYSEFSIAFRRKNEKLGVTIQEVNNCEMSIVNLHYKNVEQTEPLLAMQAGVQIGDILTGINNEYFSPVVDVEDVLDVLRLSGSYVTLHFKRKFKVQPKDISEFHKGIRYFLDNNVIVQEQVRPIDSIINRLKERTLNWNDNEITERIANWKLDPLLYKKTNVAPSTSSLFFDRFAGVTSLQSANNGRSRGKSNGYVGFQKPINSRRSIGGVDQLLKNMNNNSNNHNSSPFNTLNRRKSTGSVSNSAPHSRSNSTSHDDTNTLRTKSSSSHSLLSPITPFLAKSDVSGSVPPPLSPVPRDSSNTLPLASLRPALSFRVLHAEDQGFDYIAYVIWVTDVVSGVEWVIRKRYKEFFELREQIIALRPAVEKLEFPPKGFAVSESTIIVEERLRGLQKFLYRILCLTAINTLHPSTVRISLLVQRFLFVDDHQDLIDSVAQTATPELKCTQMAQVFTHNIIHMQVMDKVVVRFIDNFLENLTEDMARYWTEREGDKVAQELKTFLDHLQNFLCDAFYDDCKDIVNKYNSKNAGSSLLTPTAAAMSRVSKSQMTEEDTKAMHEVLIMLSEDEQRSLIRSAIRRQVEIEVYVPCHARITYILNQCFYQQENALHLKIAHILSKPQSFFSIPEEHQSPSKWNCIVQDLKEIRSKTLPSDRIDWIVQVAKEIPKLYQVEHPDVDKPLGADEMLPIFIYILVMAEIPDLIALNHELQCLCDPDKRLSEHGYYLATFEASLQHILEAEITDQSQFLFNIPIEDEEEEPEGSAKETSSTSSNSRSRTRTQSDVSSKTATNIQKAKELNEANENKYRGALKKSQTVKLILQKI